MRLRELSIKYAPTAVYVERPQVFTPATSAALLRPLLDPEPAEVFGVLLLNTKRRVLAWHPVSRGSLNSTVIEPREVFRAAILANAASIIAAHNHPSGDPAPSPEDRAITLRLRDAGTLIGIDLLDHLIIGNETNRYFSFREDGTL
jgi:DNA repair protein RadC